MDKLVRTRLAFSLFFAAYMAEALRVVVPSLVNIFIAAFKDTSLVVVISMMDLLGTADIARSDAAGRLTASDRAALRAAEAAIVRLRPGQQPREMIPAIRAFHFTVYGAARMPALLRLIEGLWLRAAPAVNLLFPDYTGRERGQLRGQVLAALESGDAEVARAAMQADIGQALDYLIDLARADAATGGAVRDDDRRAVR